MTTNTRTIAVVGLAFVVLGAIVGSGAFTSASIDRTATVTTAADSSALLALTSGHSGAVESGGTLTFNFTQGANSETILGFINVTNQGTQTVAVWLVDSDATGGGGTGYSGDVIGDQDEDNTGNITFFNSTYGGGATDASECENGVPSVEGQANAVGVPAGETFVVDLEINATGVSSEEADFLDELTVHANASISANATVGGPGLGTAC